MEQAELAKLKGAKLPVVQGVMNYFPRALKEVARVSVYGVNAHGTTLAEKGFLRPEWTEEMYLDAIGRHILDHAIEGEFNPRDGELLHRAQLAWNTLAYLEIYLIKQENEIWTSTGHRF